MLLLFVGIYTREPSEDTFPSAMDFGLLKGEISTEPKRIITCTHKHSILVAIFQVNLG